MLPQASDNLSQKDVSSPPNVEVKLPSSLIVFNEYSFTLFPGELKLGSGEVPIDETWLCESADDAGESVLLELA